MLSVKSISNRGKNSCVVLDSVNHVIMSHYQPVNNGQVRSRPDPENFRLLSITESSDEASELKRRHSPKENPPDLKLNMPSGGGGSNKMMSAAGKIRRKIRLKRYTQINLRSKF